MLKIRRALISVWDKKYLIDFAKTLTAFNVEIISTGKTASLLRKSGIPVSEVSSITSFEEILSGRVKTLHPKIFGGILVNKKHPLHMEEIKNLDIQPFDMVVVNLYPFIEKLQDNLTWDEMIEYIDIGGQALLRAAGKNYKNVACLSNCLQYKMVAEELNRNKGFIGEETLKKLAQEAFYLTKEYDNCIFKYFSGQNILSWDLENCYSLRYGENFHQKAGLYKLVHQKNLKFRQIQGKELSYNNFLDFDTAYNCVKEFNEPAAVIVKHASICGAGVDKKLFSAYKKAYLTDTLSSFGAVIGLNRKVDKETARQIIKSGFKECIVAPLYSKEALKLFCAKKNMRVLEVDFTQKNNLPNVRSTAFGFLLQDNDSVTFDKNNFKLVTKRKPTLRELKDVVLAWKVVKHVKSNAIVICKNRCITGIGGGQPSRVDSVKIALDKADKSVKGSILASDGFFPKEDAVNLACRKGVKVLVQPGGSIKDEDIIKLCEELKVTMLFTGFRHFRH